MSRRGVLLAVFVALFVLLCVGWAIASQALAGDSGRIAAAGQQTTEMGVSAFDPITPPPPPRK
jgi:hypothetical protein